MVRPLLRLAALALVALGVHGCAGAPASEPASFSGRLLIAWQSRLYELEEGLTEPRELFPLPRGSWIVAVSRDARLAIAHPRALVDLRTGETRALPVPKADADAEVFASFSPGNRYLGYVLSDTRDTRAWIVDLETNEATLVFEGPCATYVGVFGGRVCGDIGDLDWLGREALAVAAYTGTMPGSIESYGEPEPPANTLLLFGAQGNELQRFKKDLRSLEGDGSVWSLDAGGSRLLAEIGDTLTWFSASDLLAGRFRPHELARSAADDPGWFLSGSLAPDGDLVLYRDPSSGDWLVRGLPSGDRQPVDLSDRDRATCVWAPNRTSLACQRSWGDEGFLDLVPLSGAESTEVLRWSEHYEDEFGEMPPRSELTGWGEYSSSEQTTPQLVAWTR